MWQRGMCTHMRRTCFNQQPLHEGHGQWTLSIPECSHGPKGTPCSAEGAEAYQHQEGQLNHKLWSAVADPTGNAVRYATHHGQESHKQQREQPYHSQVLPQRLPKLQLRWGGRREHAHTHAAASEMRTDRHRGPHLRPNTVPIHHLCTSL